jgi:hypothetical protein
MKTSTPKPALAPLFGGLAALAIAPATARADEPASPPPAPVAQPAAIPPVVAPPPVATPALAPVAGPQAAAPSEEWHMRSPKMFTAGAVLAGVAVVSGAGAAGLLAQSEAQAHAPGHGDGAGALSAFGGLALGVVGIGSALAAVPLMIIGGDPQRGPRAPVSSRPEIAVGAGRASASWTF